MDREHHLLAVSCDDLNLLLGLARVKRREDGCLVQQVNTFIHTR